MCELKRDGAVIGVANPTPASVTVDKSKNNISILCTKDGHFDGSGVAESTFEGMTFGNIIFGGVIGVGIDAASGAMNQYPASVTVVLPPKAFASGADRDAFYGPPDRPCHGDAENAIKTINKECDPANQSCSTLVSDVEAERDTQIKLFETQRASAAIQ